MNKILNYIKNSLLGINLIILLYFIKQNGMDNYFMLYIIGFIVLLYITLKDFKNRVIPSERYHILFIVVELLVIFLFLRALFDPSFICNCSSYQELLASASYFDVCTEFRFSYFNQNIIYILILYFILYGYHKMECPYELYKPSQYSKASILLCLIHILTIPTIMNQAYNTNFPIPFFLLEIGLVCVEVITLIKYNHKKRDYPIYICFLFNLFAFISIFV